jgi:formamidopyrimidine-DNA glycosylase
MFELPELTTIASQMADTVSGKTIAEGFLGNTPHKFVWYNREHDEFTRLVRGKRVGQAHAEGKWLFVPLEPGYVLLLGEWGGRILYHPSPAAAPAKYHLYLGFEDGSAFSATTQMWGGVGLFEQGLEREYTYVKDMRTQPSELEFTFEHFATLAKDARADGKRSVKGLLTQEGFVPGVGNAIAQDIMFRARLHPKRDLAELTEAELRALYVETVTTVRDVIEAGGRNDERDLYGNKGGYARLMDAKAVGRPCPNCGTPIQKLQYLGGACYVCSTCQV